MNVKDIVEELRKMGIKVEARKRTDGGYVITKINGVSYSGAKGNQAAREMLGITLSEARIKQVNYNVEKYIKKEPLSKEMKKKIDKVQRTWRKHKVGGKAKITTKKVRRHIKEHGETETKEYLRKMSKYGEGIAYEENVEYLAKYAEDIGRVFDDRNSTNMANEFYKLADYIRSIADHFKEEWIWPSYQDLYFVRDMGYMESTGEAAISTIYNRIS